MSTYLGGGRRPVLVTDKKEVTGQTRGAQGVPMEVVHVKRREARRPSVPPAKELRLLTKSAVVRLVEFMLELPWSAASCASVGTGTHRCSRARTPLARRLPLNRRHPPMIRLRQLGTNEDEDELSCVESGAPVTPPPKAYAILR
jgi:hypothetical protein